MRARRRLAKTPGERLPHPKSDESMDLLSSADHAWRQAAGPEAYDRWAAGWRQGPAYEQLSRLMDGTQEPGWQDHDPVCTEAVRTLLDEYKQGPAASDMEPEA